MSMYNVFIRFQESQGSVIKLNDKVYVVYAKIYTKSNVKVDTSEKRSKSCVHFALASLLLYDYFACFHCIAFQLILNNWEFKTTHSLIRIQGHAIKVER